MRQLAQVNPQLGPPRRAGDARQRIVGGLGSTPQQQLSDLLSSFPDANGPWQQVSSQLTLEGNGVGTEVYNGAAQRFVSEFNGLTTNTGAFGFNQSDYATAAQAAAQVVTNNSTIAGAASIVSGMVGAALQGSLTPQQAVMGVTSVVALAASTIPGVGAAIAIGITLVGALLSSAFGNPPPPPVATVCGNGISFKPTYVVGCMFTTGTATFGGPSAPRWRRFPQRPPGQQPSFTVTPDAWWYFQNSGPIGGVHIAEEQITTWGPMNDAWYGVLASYDNQNNTAFIYQRPIDAAFPQFHQLECDYAAAYVVANLPASGGPYPAVVNNVPQVATASADDVKFAQFVLAFFKTWETHHEYDLNGMNPPGSSQSDPTGDQQLLVNFVSLWNAAHQPGNTHALQARPQGSSNDKIGWKDSCRGTFNDEYWYVQMLVGDLQSAPPTSAFWQNNGFVIHTGAAITPPGLAATIATAIARTTSVAGSVAGGSGATTSTTIENVAKGTAVVVGVGLLGAFLYARHKRTTTKAVLGKVWKKTGGTIRMPRLPQHLHLPHIGKKR